MSYRNVFRYATAGILLAAFASVFLHTALLLLSDSAMYRYWIMIQIGLHILGGVLLIGIAKFSKPCLFGFAFLSFVFATINAVKINYGSEFLHLVIFIICWVLYGSAIRGVWHDFEGRQVGQSAA